MSPFGSLVSRVKTQGASQALLGQGGMGDMARNQMLEEVKKRRSRFFGVGEPEDPANPTGQKARLTPMRAVDMLLRGR